MGAKPPTRRERGRAAATACSAAPPPPGEEQHLFEFQIRTMLTRTTGHGDPKPQHTIWRAA